jgi:hypothetical protein
VATTGSGRRQRCPGTYLHEARALKAFVPTAVIGEARLQWQRPGYGERRKDGMCRLPRLTQGALKGALLTWGVGWRASKTRPGSALPAKG